MQDYVKVGIGVLILKDGKALFGKRKGSHGAGLYALPGGSLEFGEGFAECAKREVLEECGLQIDNVRFMAVANELLREDGKHFADILLAADWISGEPVVVEAEKCDGWSWHAFDELPDPLYPMSRIAVDSYTTGKNFWDL